MQFINYIKCNHAKSITCIEPTTQSSMRVLMQSTHTCIPAEHSPLEESLPLPPYADSTIPDSNLPRKPKSPFPANKMRIVRGRAGMRSMWGSGRWCEGFLVLPWSILHPQAVPGCCNSETVHYIWLHNIIINITTATIINYIQVGN